MLVISICEAHHRRYVRSQKLYKIKSTIAKFSRTRSLACVSLFYIISFSGFFFSLLSCYSLLASSSSCMDGVDSK